MEVYHSIQYFEKLINDGELNLNGKLGKKITYHDPCHLGRHMKIYEIPRDILSSIPGVQLVEMERNRGNAWCCGAGGGVKIGYPEWSVEISKERLDEAKLTGASVISSICPFCKTNLSDANKKFKMDFEVIDIIEILENLDITISYA